MNAVNVAIGCAVAALIAGSALSQMSTADRERVLRTARLLNGGATEAPAVPSRPSIPGPAGVPAPSPVAEGEVIAADRRGQFETSVEVEGQTLPVLVDTGATYVALSYDDADRLGIRPMPADFRLPMSTANGRTYAAPVRLASIRLGGIVVRDVPAIVAGRGQMSQTLLGMSFLSRLSSVRVEDGRLMLKP